jgi:hypothetical protein
VCRHLKRTRIDLQVIANDPNLPARRLAGRSQGNRIVHASDTLEALVCEFEGIEVD